jgi:hypothetical protein
LQDLDVAAAGYRLHCAASRKNQKVTATRLLSRSQEQSVDDDTNRIDYEQLQITNQRVQEAIAQRNKKLLLMKLVSSNIQHAADSKQQQLETVGKKLAVIQLEINSRDGILRRLTREHQTVLGDREKATATNTNLKKQVATYTVPGVMEYVHDKQKLITDRRQAGTLQRRLSLAEAELAQHRKVWQTLRSPHPM